MPYTRLRRVKDAFKHIKKMFAISATDGERTISKEVANTYGVETALVKRMKARFRNELSPIGEGK